MNFLKSVRDEMKLVTWPSGKELSKYTNTVIVTVLLFAAFFAVVDFGVVELLDLVMSL
ncbi:MULTISPECIES: preprotein translocase subunit SecE [unclassified Jeotgalibaca]|uniref:preprotein translocase subunit SecE n=1 Tax=unclassified Jeotgalibaca TaxID=2621505 RepID=UPI003FD095DD